VSKMTPVFTGRVGKKHCCAMLFRQHGALRTTRVHGVGTARVHGWSKDACVYSEHGTRPVFTPSVDRRP